MTIKIDPRLAECLKRGNPGLSLVEVIHRAIGREAVRCGVLEMEPLPEVVIPDDAVPMTPQGVAALKAAAGL
ncbi:hypothetical protein [Rehaibacterium terrae]|uniref:Uncharacterized protein n=1 Tax=Rehaibacterium terrae TaxID=1341696 RepID=A0A7W7Y0E2_9GAMM|nr:hypothetical protein [Rehaibacterium terrae]MBB5015598.1 hypothetical protein [Rehaibacterium terrae]